MNIEGTVSISLKDFDELRKKAEMYEQLIKELGTYTTMDLSEEENGDPITEIKINAEKIAKMVVKHSDIEEIFEDDKIIFTNMKSMIAEK